VNGARGRRASFRVLVLAASALVLALVSVAEARPTGRYHGPRWAEPPESSPQPARVAMGFQFDLFPTVISAVNGRPGYAPQVWAGVKPVRLRLIGAHLEPPDALTFDDEVVDLEITVVAATIDYTFGRHFDGVWLGAGVESWLEHAAAADGSGGADWSTHVFTAGGGYIWRFAGTFYLDPWVGLHWKLNPQTRRIGSVDYASPPLQPTASVKVGWFFWAD
jgi:hypothetical protein